MSYDIAGDMCGDVARINREALALRKRLTTQFPKGGQMTERIKPKVKKYDLTLLKELRKYHKEQCRTPDVEAAMFHRDATGLLARVINTLLANARR